MDKNKERRPKISTCVLVVVVYDDVRRLLKL